MENINILIRKAVLQDLQDIISLLFQLSPPTSDEKIRYTMYDTTMRSILNNHDYYIYVAILNNNLIATGTLLIQMNLSHGCKPYGHIENVVTDKRYRGKGIGHKIINRLISEACKRDCYKVILNCSSNNIHFYTKCRFFETGNVEMRITL